MQPRKVAGQSDGQLVQQFGVDEEVSGALERQLLITVRQLAPLHIFLAIGNHICRGWIYGGKIWDEYFKKKKTQWMGNV